MKRIILLSVFALTIATNAFANATDDGNAGLDALNSGNYDKAISLFTRAIDSGQLADDDKEFAYLNRGNAYTKKNDYKNAVSDLREALRLKPDDPDAQSSLNFALSKTTTAGVSTGARPSVGKLLQDAIDLTENGNSDAASAKVRQVEEISDLTSSEQRAIAQVKSFIDAKSGRGPTAVQAKFAADYNAAHYAAVVGEDVEALRKEGEYNDQNKQIVAQAYYLMGNYPAAETAIREIIASLVASGGTPSQSLRNLLNSSLALQGKGPE